PKPQPPASLEQAATRAGKLALQASVGGVPHLEALERGLAPRQRKSQRDRDKQSPEPDPPGVVHARADHREADAAPNRPCQPVAAGAVNGELQKEVIEQRDWNRGESLQPFGF